MYRSLQQACRTLARRPVLSITAIATIALGVGANSAIFTLINGVLLSPLPFRDPARLTYIWQTHPVAGNLQVTYPDFVDWRGARSFSDIAAYTFQAMNKVPLEGEGVPQQLQATMASPELFPMMGITMLAGRSFTVDENRRGQRVALVSESVWRRSLGASPNLVGRTIRLGTSEFTVVGIVRRRQAFPVWADIWLPLSLLEPGLQNARRFHPLEVVGRLANGVTVQQARAEMSAIAANLANEHPATDKNIGAFVVPVADHMTSAVRPALLISWMAVGLVLLIACANVAHLFLARTMSRSRELAIRAALGASQRALIGFVATEYLLLIVCGSVIGAGLAAVAVPALKALAANYVPRLDTVAFDARVAVYTIGAMLAASLFTALPSLSKAARADLAHTARQSDTQLFSGRTGRFGPAMIALEIALAFVVVASAALLTRSFAALRQVDPGFRTDGVLTVTLSTTPGPDGWAGAFRLFTQQLEPALRALPAVTSVAAANMAPLALDRTETSRYASRFGIKGRPYAPGSYPVAQLRWVSPDYFATLGIGLRRGRLLTANDHNQPHRVINETLARRFFPGQDPIGKELLTGVDTPSVSASEIVGVVADARDLSLDLDPRPAIYLIDTSPQIGLLVRSNGDPRQLVPAITEIVHKADREAAVTLAVPLSGLVESSMARYTFALRLMAVFAALAGLLASIGVYGVVAYSVGRRTREFGIRIAVGAAPVQLMRLVVGESLVVCGMGIALGLGLFLFVVSNLFRPVLFEVSPVDGVSVLAAVPVVAAIAVSAMLIPARRASRTEPTVSLRFE